MRILVIEDSPLLRENLCDLLEAEGFETEAADDGDTGLAMACAKPPDLILCDVRMPRMSGLDVLRALRGDARVSSVPLLLLSGYGDEASREEGRALGANGFIPKPFDEEDLFARIEHFRRS